MSNEINNLYEFGGFRLNAQTNTLWRGKDLVPLSPKAFELLKLLVEKQGEVVSKQEMFDKVWAETFVEDGVLTQNIYTLRQTLGTDENGKQLIENIARRGYRLTVPVIFEKDKQPQKQANSENMSADVSPKTSSVQFPFAVKIIVGAILLAIISFFGYQFFAPKPSETPKIPIAELKFKQLTDTGDASYLTISPNGNLAAYTRGFDIFLRNLQTETEVKLNTEQPKKAACLQFSPDEKFIYFGNVYNHDEKGSVFRFRQTAKS